MTIAASRPPVPGDLSITSPLGWAHEVEAELQAADPAGHFQTAGNDAVLVAWAQKEGGYWHNSAYGNPLGTTKKEPGSTSINSVGVQSYTSWRQGLAATVAMFKQGNMSGILSALAGGSPNPANTAVAIGDSPWLNGHTSPSGTPTAYGSSIISLLGKGYAPTVQPGAAPTPESAQSANIEQAGLGLHTFTDPFGLLGGAASGAIGGVVGGAIGDVEDYIGKFAIRAALVLFGSLFVLVGLAILFRGGDDEKSEESSDDGGDGGGSSTPREPPPRRRPGDGTPDMRTKAGKSGHGFGTDVEETAEGAAEAV